MANISDKHRAEIAKAYSSANTRTELTANLDRILETSLFRGISRKKVVAAAMVDGLSRQRTNKSKWTPEEDAFLQKLVDSGSFSIYQINRAMKRKGWSRSVAAIANRINGYGYSIKLDVYCLSQVEEALDVYYRKVSLWIADGKLKGKRAEPSYKHRDPKGEPRWEIKPKDLARFIRSYPEELQSARPDVPWLVSLLGEFKG